MSGTIISFGAFEVLRTKGELRRNGLRIKLQEQPFRVLTILLDRSGDVVTREEFREQLWPDGTFVEFEHALNTSVHKLRCALGDNANRPRYIKTVPRKGYRFVGVLDAGPRRVWNGLIGETESGIRRLNPALIAILGAIAGALAAILILLAGLDIVKASDARGPVAPERSGQESRIVVDTADDCYVSPRAEGSRAR